MRISNQERSKYTYRELLLQQITGPQIIIFKFHDEFNWYLLEHPESFSGCDSYYELRPDFCLVLVL